MKELIRQILKEEKDVKVLKNFIFKIFQSQVRSGLTPHIPYEDLRRKKITQYIELIDKWYFEFLENHYGVNDGFEKAKTLFTDAVKIVTEEDLKKMDINVGEDKFEVSVPWLVFSDRDLTQINVRFGFEIIDCYLETEVGMKTYEEMLSNNFSDYLWNDVTDFLRNQIGEYIQKKGYDFGLNIFDTESYWAD
jgi:hypothetical protein